MSQDIDGGKIKREGSLYAKGGGQYLICPRGDGRRNCGEWCPLCIVHDNSHCIEKGWLLLVCCGPQTICYRGVD